MKFPSEKEIEKALKKLSKADPTLVIDYKNSSRSDILKYQLCQEFVKVLKEEGLTQVELAKKLKVDKAIVNKIVHHKIESFSVDRLLDLFSQIRNVEIFLKAS